MFDLNGRLAALILFVLIWILGMCAGMFSVLASVVGVH